MEEEIITLNEEQPENPENQGNQGQPSLLPGFKSVCMRLGAMMIIVFLARVAAEVGATLLQPYFDGLKPVWFYVLQAGMSLVFLYGVPMISAVFLLGNPLKGSGVYSKPKYFGRAMAMFPAGYGIAITVNLVTILVGTIFRGTSVGDSFTATQDAFVVPDMASAVVLFLQMTIMAPIFEEMWFRGMVMESLRPYGNGFAIFISAILFGLTHSNFAQFFYATALGIFLGYIAVSTRSIITTTIMHAMFNSISGLMVLLSANESVGDYLLAKDEQAVITPAVVLYFVWLGLVMTLMVVGVIMAIYKFIKIKKYKVPKVQNELSAPKRWGIFLSRATVIIMIILAADAFSVKFLASGLYSLLLLLSGQN